jgi:hypothetical protein
MPILLGLWWLGATTSALTVPVVLPAGEAAEDWRHALSLCVSYRLTPSVTAPSSGPMVRIESTASGWQITVRDEGGAKTTSSVSRANKVRPHDEAANLACSHLSPTSAAAGGIPLPALPPPEATKPPDDGKKGGGKAGKGGGKASAKAGSAAPTPPAPIEPPPAAPLRPAPLTLRPLAPGEQLDGLMPDRAAGVCTCSWITDDSDLRSDDARWSFAPDCITCEPAPPLEIREDLVDRHNGGRR